MFHESCTDIHNSNITFTNTTTYSDRLSPNSTELKEDRPLKTEKENLHLNPVQLSFQW